MSPRRAPSKLTPRWARLVRSTWGRVLLLVVVLVVVANLGASAALVWDNFDDYFDALWWSIRSLLDPGSLGDDEAWDERIIGAVLTILGLVVLLGIVIEVVTNAVDNSLRRLDEIDVRVRARGHLVVFGWSELVPDVLRRIPRPRPVVVIAPASEREHRDDLVGTVRAAAPRVSPTVVFDHGGGDTSGFELAALEDAAAVLVHREDRAGPDPDTADVDVVERTFRVRAYLDEQLGTRADDHGSGPAVLYDVLRARNVDIAAPLLPEYDAIVVDRMITGTIRLGLDCPPWGDALTALLGPGPGSIGLVGAERWKGRHGADVAREVDAGLAIAVLDDAHRVHPLDASRPIEATDELVMLAPSGDDPRDALATVDEPRMEVAAPPVRAGRSLRVLLVGWNHRMPVYVEELADRPPGELTIASYSDVPADVRRAEIPAALADRVPVQFLDHEPGSPDGLTDVLERLRPDVVVIGPTLRTGAAADAETRRRADAEALLHVLRIAALPDHDGRVLVADLLLPHAGELYATTPAIRVVPTATIRARAMGRLLDEPRLGAVFTALFEGGVTTPDAFAFAPTDGAPRPFAAARTAYLRHGIVVVGVHREEHAILAPDPGSEIAAGTTLLALRTP